MLRGSKAIIAVPRQQIGPTVKRRDLLARSRGKIANRDILRGRQSDTPNQANL